MRIEGIIWFTKVVDKLYSKHQIRVHEVEEVFDNESNKVKIRFVEEGERESEDVYLALGRTEAGRYLAVFFIYKLSKKALIVTARNMTKGEKNQYGRK